MYLKKRGEDESVHPKEHTTSDWSRLKTHMIPPTAFDSTRTYDLGQLFSRAPVLGYTETIMQEVNSSLAEYVSFSAASQLLGKRWTLLIIGHLLTGPLSFRGLLKQMRGISDRMLTYRLKELEREGILLREVYREAPIRVSYRLTRKGEALGPVIRAINEWSNWHGNRKSEYQLEPGEAETDEETVN